MLRPAVIEDFLGMLFPCYCLACHTDLVRGEENVCAQCKHDLPRTNYHLKPRNDLRFKFDGKVPVKHTLAYLTFTKHEKVQRLVAAFKYKNNVTLGYQLGSWYGNELKPFKERLAFDALIPIPLHPKKLKQRGFNQSQIFAEGITRTLDVPTWPGLLVRKTATKTQTRKSRMERWENVRDIFEVRHASLLQGKHVVVVDDIVTTGATLESAVAVLLDTGAKEVSVLALAEAKLF